MNILEAWLCVCAWRAGLFFIAYGKTTISNGRGDGDPHHCLSLSKKASERRPKPILGERLILPLTRPMPAAVHASSVWRPASMGGNDARRDRRASVPVGTKSKLRCSHGANRTIDFTMARHRGAWTCRHRAR